MIYDIAALNSATKYPSIPTYHALDPKDGSLIEDQPTEFSGPVVLTEKVNGANGRVVVMGDDFFIGSREDLLYARGDRIVNPVEQIVPALLPFAKAAAARERRFSSALGALWVFYLEVYGSRTAGSKRNYTTGGLTGYRLFDVAGIAEDVLGWPREQIASWREHGGQGFLSEMVLQDAAAAEGVQLTPRLGTVDGEKLPRDLKGMLDLLTFYAPETRVALDDGALGAAEGIVLRSEDRSVITKAKFADYERTLRRREGKR